MNKKQLQNILLRLNKISILVLGDYFLDKYLLLDPSLNEKSIETGLVAYQTIEKKLSPGAAGTVANNLSALGVGNIISLGVIADDGEGYELIRGLRNAGVNTDHMVITTDGITPTYIKPILINQDGNQEQNRIDIKNRKPTSDKNDELLAKRLIKLSNEVDAIVVMDQVTEPDCGTVTRRVRTALSKLGEEKSGLTIYADSRSFSREFNNIIIKCNKYELVRAFYPDFYEKPIDALIMKCGEKLAKEKKRPVFVTLGSKGQLVFDGDSVTAVAAVPVDGPFDICGAGDATTAGIISALCCGASNEDVALLGNIIASITIQQLETTGTASPEQVLERYDRLKLSTC